MTASMKATLLFFLIVDCATAIQTVPMQERAEQAAVHVRNVYGETGPGAAYLISQSGRVLIAGGVGYANLEWDGEMKSDTPVRIGSLSKPITAIMVVQLAEKGLLDLDKAVRFYAPDLPEQFGAVTMRQYLSHRSGVKDLLIDPALLEHVWLPITTDELIELAKDAPSSFPPGKKYEYVNFNYVIVAHVIEKVMGQSYEDAIASFFDVNGMTNSHFDAHSAVIKNRAAAYELRNGDVLNVPGLDLSHLSGAGGLLSSAQDLNRWIALLVDGDLISKKNLNEVWTPQPLPDGTPTTYALGFNEREFCGKRVIWHTGLAPGGQAAFMLAPDQGLFTVVLSNAYNTPNTGKLSREMMAVMLTGDVQSPCASE